MKLHTREIVSSGRAAVVACDGHCHKAWGIIDRPKLNLGGGDDDTVLLADGELGEAPSQSMNWEGGFNKPPSPDEMNRWCTRQCERSQVVDPGQPIVLPDFSVRRYNQPWLHLQTLQESGHPQLQAAQEINRRMAADAQSVHKPDVGISA